MSQKKGRRRRETLPLVSTAKRWAWCQHRESRGVPGSGRYHPASVPCPGPRTPMQEELLEHCPWSPGTSSCLSLLIHICLPSTGELPTPPSHMQPIHGEWRTATPESQRGGIGHCCRGQLLWDWMTRVQSQIGTHKRGGRGQGAESLSSPLQGRARLAPPVSGLILSPRWKTSEKHLALGGPHCSQRRGQLPPSLVAGRGRGRAQVSVEGPQP